MATKKEDACKNLTKMVGQEPERLTVRIGRIIGDTAVAEDLAQDSLLRALRNIDSLRGPADEPLLCKWLDRIAHNVAVNHVRDDQRKPAVCSIDDSQTNLTEQLPDVEPAPDTAVSQNETAQQLQNLINTLPPDLQDVLILRDVKGMSTKETAVALDIKEGLVKWRLHQARQQLREQILSDIGTT